MFTRLFDDTQFIASHWFVVLCAGLAFLAVQLALSVRFYVRMRRQEKSLNARCQDFEQARADQAELLARSGDSGWVRWVIANYATARPGAAGKFTREDALHEFDARVAGSSDYLLLQRMGIMAPLLGVVLTVVGFYWLDIGDDEQSLQAILLAVAPLVSGVGTGAVLALINQALLHVAGLRAESLRMTARKWFDMAIWSHAAIAAPSSAGRAGDAIEQWTAALGDASARYAHSANQIDASTASMNKAASQFHGIVQSFGAEMRGIPAALDDVRRAAAASANSLEELIKIGSRAVANLDVSVAAFRTTIDREFAAAAKLQHRSGRLLATSVRRFEDATERIQSGSYHLNKTAQTSEASFQRMDESIRQHVVRGNEHFSDAVQALTSRVAEFSHEVTALSAIVESVAGEFNQMTGGLVPSVSALRDAIDNRLGAAVAKQAKHIEAVNQSMQRLRDAANGMSQGSTTLNAMLGELSQIVGQTSATHDALAHAAGHLAEVANQLRHAATSDVAASQRTIDEIAASLDGFKTHMADFVSTGLDPATKRLAVLHDTLADLEDAVVAISELGDPEANGDRVTDAPAQTSQGKGILRDGNEADAQSGFLEWLTRRPR